MDERRFDHLTRTLARTTTRRGALTALLAGLAAGLGLAARRAPAAAQVDLRLDALVCLGLTPKLAAQVCVALNLPHVAKTGCVTGRCAILACQPGWANCDGRVQTGCETPLGTREHCAACGDSCARLDDACHTGACAGGSCVAQPANAGGGCDDGNPCTLNDLCQADGRCLGTPRGCDPPQVCQEPGVCNSATGACEYPVKPPTLVCRPAAGPCDVAETCTGSDGACPADAFQPSDVECRPASCVDGVATLPATCSGTDAACPPAQTQTCAPFVCDGTACRTICTADEHCIPSHHCDDGQCLPDEGLGAPCDEDSDCQSGVCAQGVCCNQACAAPCNVCSAATGGVCTPAQCTTPSICQTGPGTCNAQTGACVYPEAADGTECGTDRVCCDGVCCGGDQVCHADTGGCCTPTTCAAQGASCGTISDGCGGTLECGSCAAGEACVGNQCQVTCLENGVQCTSADQCCDDEACESVFFRGQICCIPLGEACQIDPIHGGPCCGGPPPDQLPGQCRDDVCCIQEGSECERTADCCQTPVTAQCQAVSTCNQGTVMTCCRPLGSPCNSHCECCDGYCVDGDGLCSAICKPRGSRCVRDGECCSLLCGGVPNRCD